MSSPTGDFARIRHLHRPVWHTFTTLKGTPGATVHCEGCDLGPHPEDYPDWPCSTAELVYTPEEIAELSQPPAST